MFHGYDSVRANLGGSQTATTGRMQQIQAGMRVLRGAPHALSTGGSITVTARSNGAGTEAGTERDRETGPETGTQAGVK